MCVCVCVFGIEHVYIFVYTHKIFLRLLSLLLTCINTPSLCNFFSFRLSFSLFALRFYDTCATRVQSTPLLPLCHHTHTHTHIHPQIQSVPCTTVYFWTPSPFLDNSLCFFRSFPLLFEFLIVWVFVQTRSKHHLCVWMGRGCCHRGECLCVYAYT